MKLEIITPEKAIYSGDIKLIKVPGSKGSFAVMENHAPLISTLDAGQIKIISPKGEEKFFEVKGGVVEIANNKVIVLADM